MDRSGAYIARQAAKSVVAAGLARRCLVQVRSPAAPCYCWSASRGAKHARHWARPAAEPVSASTLPCASPCLRQVSYAIGVPEPLSVFVDTYGTGKIPDSEILTKGGSSSTALAALPARR